MRFDAEGSVGSAKKADMESGSESASDSGSREKVLVTELKHDNPVHEGWNPTLMNGNVTVKLYMQTEHKSSSKCISRVVSATTI